METFRLYSKQGNDSSRSTANRQPSCLTINSPSRTRVSSNLHITCPCPHRGLRPSIPTSSILSLTIPSRPLRLQTYTPYAKWIFHIINHQMPLVVILHFHPPPSRSYTPYTPTPAPDTPVVLSAPGVEFALGFKMSGMSVCPPFCASVTESRVAAAIGGVEN